MKKTLVVGASTNSARYSYKAILKLRTFNHEVSAYGLREGAVCGVNISTEWPSNEENLHTVTMYINPTRQAAYYQKIIDLKPKRVIFNPGTENAEFEELLEAANIISERSCTLVLLSIGNY